MRGGPGYGRRDLDADSERVPMWLKTRKMNALLAPLSPVIGGQVCDGVLSGSHGGYAVEVQPHSGYPIKYLDTASDGGVPPARADSVGGRPAAAISRPSTWGVGSSAGSSAATGGTGQDATAECKA